MAHDGRQRSPAARVASTRRRASWAVGAHRHARSRCRPSSTTSPRCSRSGRSCPLEDRARYMRRAAQVIIDPLDELAELLTREQGKPRNEAYVMELLPTIDALHWIADDGPKILADERIKLPQLFLQAEERAVRLRAARRGRRDRALELPVVDPVRRGRDRADGRQRRGAEARVAHAADRRADPRGVRARRAARGPRADRARRRRGGQGAGRVERGEDLLHRLRRGRPRRGRGVRRADEGLACSSWAARTRRSCSRTPTSPTRSRAACGAASPTPARPARASSACT